MNLAIEGFLIGTFPHKQLFVWQNAFHHFLWAFSEHGHIAYTKFFSEDNQRSSIVIQRFCYSYGVEGHTCSGPARTHALPKHIRMCDSPNADCRGTGLFLCGYPGTFQTPPVYWPGGLEVLSFTWEVLADRRPFALQSQSITLDHTSHITLSTWNKQNQSCKKKTSRKCKYGLKRRNCEINLNFPSRVHFETCLNLQWKCSFAHHCTNG